MASVAFGMEEASLLQRERGKRTTNFVGDSEFLVVLCWVFFRGGGGGVAIFWGVSGKGGRGEPPGGRGSVWHINICTAKLDLCVVVWEEFARL